MLYAYCCRSNHLRKHEGSRSSIMIYTIVVCVFSYSPLCRSKRKAHDIFFLFERDSGTFILQKKRIERRKTGESFRLPRAINQSRFPSRNPRANQRLDSHQLYVCYTLVGEMGRKLIGAKELGVCRSKVSPCALHHSGCVLSVLFSIVYRIHTRIHIVRTHANTQPVHRDSSPLKRGTRERGAQQPLILASGKGALDRLLIFLVVHAAFALLAAAIVSVMLLW